MEAGQACTALSSNGQLMSSNANAAQDLSSHGLDLHSPDKVATASQVGAMTPTSQFAQLLTFHWQTMSRYSIGKYIAAKKFTDLVHSPRCTGI